MQNFYNQYVFLDSNSNLKYKNESLQKIQKVVNH